MNQSLPTIAFVTGAQRSGTTLLQTLICSALPEAPILPEAHLIVDTLRGLQRARSSWEKTRYFFAGEPEVTAFFRGTLDAQLASVAALNPESKYLVLKDPNFLSVMAELAEFFPNSAIVVSVRDPRDVVGSFMKIAARAESGGVHSIYRKRDIGPICKKLDSIYLTDVPDLKRAAIVRYEDAASAPSQTLQRLRDVTGLPLADAGGSLNWLPAEARHQAQWTSELEGGPPSVESIGSYLAVLSPDEVELVERLNATLMTRYDYRPTPRPATRTLVERALRYWRLRGK